MKLHEVSTRPITENNSLERAKEIEGLYRDANDAWNKGNRLSKNKQIHDTRWRMRNDPALKRQQGIQEADKPMYNELSDDDLKTIANNMGVPFAVLKRRGQEESGLRHYDDDGNVTLGDKDLDNKAYGAFQIRQTALDEINERFGLDLTIDQIKNDPTANAYAGAAYMRILHDSYYSKTPHAKNKVDPWEYTQQAYKFGPNSVPDSAFAPPVTPTQTSVQTSTPAPKPKPGDQLTAKDMDTIANQPPVYKPIDPPKSAAKPTSKWYTGKEWWYPDFKGDKAAEKNFQQSLDTMGQSASNLGQMSKDMMTGKLSPYDAFDVGNMPGKIDKATGTSIGSTIAGTAKNISQGNVNKDSWVYKNIVEPIVGKDHTPTHIYNKETGKLEPKK
jgi:hypothetical protein